MPFEDEHEPVAEHAGLAEHTRIGVMRPSGAS